MNTLIEPYLHIRSAFAPTYTPDGRQLAFLSNITGRQQVWQVEVGPEQVSWPDQLTFASDRVLWATYSPAPGPYRLVYGHDIGGDENAQLFLLRQDPDGGLTSLLLSAGHDGAMHSFGAWVDDGEAFLFAANRRRPDIFDLYRQPLNGDEAELVWRNDQHGYLVYPSLSPDGTRLVVSRVGLSASHDIIEINLITGYSRQVNPSDRPARFMRCLYSGDGNYLYVNTDIDRDFLHIARLDLQRLTIEPIITPEWDVSIMTPSHNGRLLAYVVNEEGSGRPGLLDLESGATRSAPPIPGDGVAAWEVHMAFSPDDGQLAFSYSSPLRTFDIWTWNLRTDEVQAVTRSSHGGLPTQRFIAPQLIHYPTFDGRDIPAWFYRPEGDDRWPVVVIVHGGPESQTRPIFNFLIQYLLDNRYAVLAPNVRGSTGYGKRYSSLDDVAQRLDSVQDLAYAAQWLQQEPTIDGDRIAVYGGSYGGFMVLAALTNYPHLWSAGVDIVGISNFVSFLENTSDYRRAHRESEYGYLDQDREMLERISPLSQAAQIKAPLMVIHGANDPRVPVSEAEQLVGVLAANDIPYEYLLFDDEGHGIVKLKNKLVAYPAVVEFLDRYLQKD